MTWPDVVNKRGDELPDQLRFKQERLKAVRQEDMERAQLLQSKNLANNLTDPLSPKKGLKQWAGADLNRRHTDFQSVALPTELPALTNV
jgi:hypothetical protein